MADEQITTDAAEALVLFLQALQGAQIGQTAPVAGSVLPEKLERNLHFQFAAAATQGFLADRDYFVVFVLTTGVNVCVSFDGTTAANAAAAITKLNTGIICHITGNTSTWTGKSLLQKGVVLYVASSAAGTCNVGLELA